MAALGTIFVEMDIDRDRWAGAQRRLLKDATSTSLRIEDNFRKLGIKSSAEMDLMRRKITNSFNMIKNSSQATANDIVRAEKAKTSQLKRLNEQQFGHQTSLLKKLKANWLATSAVIIASVYAIKRVVSVIDDFVDSASDLNETISKSNTIFQEHGREIYAWAETAAIAMGMSTQAALETAATMGNMFNQLGAGTKIAADNSRQMVQLAADIASFHNVTGGATRVLDTMMSAFRGEYDALQRYIPTIKAASVQQEALAMTGKETAKELTELEKATAAMSIIIRDAGVATGDFARTSGQLANQERILQANIDNLKASIGQALIPAVTSLVIEMNKWIGANKNLIEQKTHETVDKITTSIKAMVDVYNSLPEGIVGATGYGLIGKMLFGSGVGKIIFALKILEPYFDKLPKWAKEWGVMLGGGIPPSAFEQRGETPIFRGKIPDRLKLTIGGPGQIPDRGEAESFQQMTDNLLSLTTLRGEEIIALEQLQAELLAEQMMANDTAKLEEKSNLEKYMAGLLYNDLEAMRWEHAERMVALEEQEKQMKTQVAKNWLQTTMNVGTAIMAFSGKQSKVIFAIAKAAEVAKATIAAFSASTMALAHPPGPPTTIPLSKSVLAMGLANATAIGATAIGTMAGGGSAGGAVGTYPASPATGFPEIPSGGAETKGSLTINIQGDMIGDEGYIEMLAEKISEAVKDRNVTLYASNAETADQVI